MRAIATDASRVVRRYFQLPQVPIAGSVVVSIDGVITTDYRVEGSMLVLNQVNSEQKTLHISYRHDPVPIFNSVQLSEKPDDSTLAVEVNGTVLNRDEFSFDESTGQVEFSEAPPSYAHVMVTYKPASGLSSIFDLGSFESDDAAPTVQVNGVDFTQFRFDASTGKLSFLSPPTDGSEIAVAYRPKGSKVTNYSSYRHPTGSSPLFVTFADTASKTSLDAVWHDSELIFAPSDVVDGRQVEVTYNYGDVSTPLTYRLANLPLEGSVDVRASGDAGDCVENLVVSDQLVIFNCKSASLNAVTVGYKYVQEHYSTFSLNKPIPEQAFVRVFVDGVAVEDFSVEGQVIHLATTKTKLNSVVKVQVLTRVY